MKQAVLGAGATAASLGAGGAAVRAAEEEDVAPITVPSEFETAKSASLPTVDFPMTGAQVFAKACKEEGVAALFCCPGNYSVVHAISDTGIPTYGGRHEGSLCHAADAFCRVTGEIAATSGTEGPGFTDMICAIAAANSARSPVLVLASNKTVFAEDTERGIQDAYQQPTTEGMRKYGKRLITPARVHEYAGYAFRQLKSGVPKPVHLDFPAEIANGRFRDASEIEYYFDKSKYRTETKPFPDPQAIDQAVSMIRASERPMLVSSNGVFYSKAWEPLRRLAERAQIPVVESGAMKGQFPADHELSADTAPGALASADLVLLVGQYCMPTQGEFAFGPDTKYIRIDPDAEDIGRNLPIDLGIVSDERAALEALAAEVPRLRHDAWVAEVASARDAFEAENEEYYRTGLGYTDAVHPAVIGKELADFVDGTLPGDRTTIVQGGYGIARYTRRYLRSYRPAQIMNGAYQYGAIGPDVGYTIGVAAAVRQGAGAQADYQGHPIIAITGDAGFGYTGMEMETLSKYRLPAVVIVYNNNAWGTWEGQRNNQVGLPVHLFQENLRYDKMGEALGAHGEYVTTPADFRPALERAYQVALDESRPSVVNVQAKKEFWLRDQYAPGFMGKLEPGVMSYYH
jgi:thiamine pyrophosphate-dependent acetolactate synthase large subunit-like protein|tara:strand:+ start:1401 stop:3290 length:1890 start_codon:yes stop_codon:yes gene_type:complete